MTTKTEEVARIEALFAEQFAAHGLANDPGSMNMILSRIIANVMVAENDQCSVTYRQGSVEVTYRAPSPEELDEVVLRLDKERLPPGFN